MLLSRSMLPSGLWLLGINIKQLRGIIFQCCPRHQSIFVYCCRISVFLWLRCIQQSRSHVRAPPTTSTRHSWRWTMTPLHALWLGLRLARGGWLTSASPQRSWEFASSVCEGYVVVLLFSWLLLFLTNFTSCDTFTRAVLAVDILSVPEMWVWGTVPSKAINAAGFYLSLMDLFILTSNLNADFLAQTISEIKREYWNWW